MEWVVTETPDDPSLSACWIGEATDALAALDTFAIEEGFSPYSDLIDPRDPHLLSQEETEGWIGQTEDGLVWAIFTNTTVWALPVEDGVLPKVPTGVVPVLVERTSVTFPYRKFLPPAVQVRLIADEACHAAFKVISERLEESMDAVVWGDFAPEEVLQLDRLFDLFVRRMALNAEPRPREE